MCGGAGHENSSIFVIFNFEGAAPGFGMFNGCRVRVFKDIDGDQGYAAERNFSATSQMPFASSSKCLTSSVTRIRGDVAS